MMVTLAWPPSVLSPNDRAHRMVKARATRSYRNACGMEALAGGLRRTQADSLGVRVTLHPPRRPGRMNVDNIIASLKPAVDALADVLWLDDSRLRIAWPVAFADPVKGGAVVFQIEAAG